MQILIQFGTSPIAIALIALTIAYSLFIAYLIIVENNDPRATLAWLLFLWTFPLLGLVAYLFFGRGRRAFSRERKLLKELVTAQSQPNLNRLLAQQEAFLANSTEVTLEEKRIIRLLHRNSQSLLTIHNEVEILQNAAAKYPRLLEELEKAQYSISMQYFIWESDKYTYKIKQILINKAKAGVHVRAIYDWLGSHNVLNGKDLAELRAAGVQIEAYLSPRELHNIGYRNHRKIVVIDGNVAFLGGINLSQEHLTGGKYFSFWRDTHFKVRGEAAAMLQAIFAVGWYNTTGERLDDPKLYEASQPESIVPMQIVSSGPDSQWAAIRQMYFKLIMHANHHVYIQSPFFILDDSIAEAIKTARLSGVDVQIMLTPRGGQYQVPYRAALTFCDEMSRAGARIYFYQKGYFHPKALMIDGKVCSIGTANMDIRSFSVNYETNAVFYDVDIARQMEHAFMADIANCSEFTWRDYRKESRLAHLRDSIYRLCSPLL